MNLLAKSCFNPGIIAMISNLISSSGEAENSNQIWLNEYLSGQGHEIYRVEISQKMEGQSFIEVAKKVYDQFQAIMFALEVEIEGEIVIRLNPGNYSIRNVRENAIHVYVICEEKSVADKVALLDMNTEEIDLYRCNKGKREKNENSGGEDELGIYDPNEESSTLSIRESPEYGALYDDSVEVDEKEYYDLLEEEQDLMDIHHPSIEGERDIVNHVIVCGIHSSIYHFLLPLRAKYIKEEKQQYVVILSKHQPTGEIWKKINRFPKLIYINGSPLNNEDLHRANINSADKAVILGPDPTFTQIVSDEILDAEAIFIYKTIKQCNPAIQVILELVYHSNIKYLLPSLQSSLSYQTSPLYAAGEVYISTIIDTLTCQAYFNPHIVTVLQQLLTGGVKSSNPLLKASDLKQSNLWQCPVPEDFVGKTFKHLFNYLLDEMDLIALGLYRLEGATDNSYAYVYTNPDPDSRLTHKDSVFVLGYNVMDQCIYIYYTYIYIYIFIVEKGFGQGRDEGILSKQTTKTQV